MPREPIKLDAEFLASLTDLPEDDGADDDGAEDDGIVSVEEIIDAVKQPFEWLFGRRGN